MINFGRVGEDRVSAAKGKIGEVIIFKKACTPIEIEQIINGITIIIFSYSLWLM